MPGVPLYLDTNAFIVMAEIQDERQLALEELIRLQPTDEAPMFLTSDLSLAEVLVKPLAEERTDLVALYEFWLRPSTWLTVVAVDRNVLRYAARLRASRRSLKLPDAIHLSTCLLSQCRTLLSHDGDMRDGLPLPFPGQTPPDIVRLDSEALSALKTRLIAP